MRSLTRKALIFVCYAMCIGTLCVTAASADIATYVYRGNNFVEIEGNPEIFSTKDRVKGRFTVDCDAAHPEGTCANLPYDNYFWVGAVRFESLSFSAGPASLPTADGHADINAFRFSTDSNGQIVHWDIDLTFDDPSGIINVDTDKKPWGSAIDSAAALGGGAVVHDNPGKWKRIGRPGKSPTSVFRNHNRNYGNLVGAGSCSDFDGGYRCRSIDTRENYDVKGTYEYTEASYHTERHEWGPGDGSEDHRWRVITCPVDEKSIAAHPNRVTIDLVLDSEGLGCYQEGYRYGWDPDTGDYFDPNYGFSGIWAIEGDWLDPFSYGSSMSNVKDKFYDGWSGTTFNSVHNCMSNWGDLMTRGGFSQTTPSGRTFFYPFEGPDGSAWSYYHVSSCNDNEGQK
jgi:hypothetical protein